MSDIGNPFDAIRQALQEARDVERAIDAHANNLALLLMKNLRRVYPHHLTNLKRELQNFDAHKKEWKP